MQYDPESGHRVKDGGKGRVTWVHTTMKQDGELPGQCLFGEHLLNDDNRELPVAVVESEKTAIIMSGAFDGCVVVATGGCGNLKLIKREAMRGRDVVLFPDEGMFEEWQQQGDEMRHHLRSGSPTWPTLISVLWTCTTPHYPSDDGETKLSFSR